ncbi:Permeases of the major facilitator superfamily [Lutibaculum baratangense AMV1]|uniref:Permeases of the major facilitator superfamily n=2 Tax=Lutibaculum TaxID=1358438 RepID=V4TJL0_9HYPH|nr:Permeases of the major facilitator superfamily [Lutibaculum baratangense AMV1]
MVPFVAGAAAAWWLAGTEAWFAARLTIIWGGALLIFFSGVRRGLSFRTPGGPRPAQIVMFAWLFCLGLAVLLIPSEATALSLLLAGFVSLWVLDPRAAARREVPPYFARLRRVQMLIPIACLAMLLLRAGSL